MKRVSGVIGVIGNSMARKHWSDESRDDRLKRQYSITEELYAKIAAKQDNRCAICNCHQHYQHLAVDHDHKTGMVRGLLCTNCNRGLGRFFDSPVRLSAASAYITRANETFQRVMQKAEIAKTEVKKC